MTQAKDTAVVSSTDKQEVAPHHAKERLALEIACR